MLRQPKVVVAPEEPGKRLRRIDTNACAYELLPEPCVLGSRTAEHQVVYVDRQKELRLCKPKVGGMVVNRLSANLLDGCRKVSLPVSSGVWVPVQGLVEQTHGLAKAPLVPVFRPELPRDKHPCLVFSTEQGLHVCTNRVSGRSLVTRQQAIRNVGICALNGGRRSRQFLEDCMQQRHSHRAQCRP